MVIRMCYTQFVHDYFVDMSVRTFPYLTKWGLHSIWSSHYVKIVIFIQYELQLKF